MASDVSIDYIIIVSIIGLHAFSWRVCDAIDVTFASKDSHGVQKRCATRVAVQKRLFMQLMCRPLQLAGVSTSIAL
jgi:hypothetical protein